MKKCKAGISRKLDMTSHSLDFSRMLPKFLKTFTQLFQAINVEPLRTRTNSITNSIELYGSINNQRSPMANCEEL